MMCAAPLWFAGLQLCVGRTLGSVECDDLSSVFVIDLGVEFLDCSDENPEHLTCVSMEMEAWIQSIVSSFSDILTSAYLSIDRLTKDF